MVKRSSCGISRRASTSVRVNLADGQDKSNSHKAASVQNAASGSIIIIEERALIRDCLRRCFESAFEFAIIAVRTVEECLQVCTTTDASLVIFSVAGNLKSPETVRDMARLVEGEKAWPMMVLSDGDDLDQIVSVLDNGARGYIPTDLAFDVAVEAVRLVCAGGVFIPASSLVGARLSGEPSRSVPRSTSGIFTARQAAVVDAVRRGKANKVIAFELKMRESTVKVHVRNIMKKLNAKNRTEVAFMANELLSSDLPPMRAAR
jgi:DNA-binding NarL/FixJ family response regulator